MMKNRIFMAAALLAGIMTVSCTEEIIIDNIDEGSFDQVTNLVCGLRDANTNKTTNIVDLYRENYNTELRLNINRAPGQGIDAEVSFDAEYLAKYNEDHGTSFELYPADRLKIQNDGKITLAPDEKNSYALDLEIGALDAESFKDDMTYVIPLKLQVGSEEVKVSKQESHLVYLVKNKAGKASIIRKPGDKGVICFLEVNDTNPLNVLQWKTEDGSLLTDYVVFFAYNINMNRATGEVCVKPNTQCQYILDHADEIIKPLRDSGIKVILGLLGNGDESGLAQLSPLGCKMFAKKVASICYAYNFDGVNFDDEWSQGPDLSNPLLAQRTSEAASRLCLETKRVMPDKEVTIFQYNQFTDFSGVDGYLAGDYVDICIGNYCPGRPLEGMSLSDCIADGKELARFGSITVEEARAWGASEYGYVMIFAPWAANNQGSERQYGYLSNLSEGLFGKPLVKPEFYYPQTTSFETKSINW